ANPLSLQRKPAWPVWATIGRLRPFPSCCAAKCQNVSSQHAASSQVTETREGGGRGEESDRGAGLVGPRAGPAGGPLSAARGGAYFRRDRHTCTWRVVG